MQFLRNLQCNKINKLLIAVCISFPYIYIFMTEIRMDLKNCLNLHRE